MENNPKTLVAYFSATGNTAEVARSIAGATGGTVIHARGTARPDDATFFGITIVPEKELVMILSPKDKSDRIMESIKAEFSNAEPGSGIAFRTAVESFDMLGVKRR